MACGQEDGSGSRGHCDLIIHLAKGLGVKFKVSFVGERRYTDPLDETSGNKFRALSKGCEVFVLGFSENFRPHRFTQHARFWLFPQLPVPLMRYLPLFSCGPIITVWFILRYGVNILVAQSPYSGFVAAWAKMLARCAGKRVALVIESHGDFEEAVFMQRRVCLRGIIRRLMRKTTRFALYHADVLRAISAPTRKQLAAWAPDKPIAQFPAWTDMDVFLKAGKEAHPEEDQNRYILYAGVLTPLKGVHFLLEAFAEMASKMPEVNLRIIGKKQNPEYAVALVSKVKQAGLGERVVFLDHVPQSRLAEHMAKASVFVLPSLSEGLGRVVFEAMACGTPVIGSRVGGIPELIEHGVTGFLVPPGDKEALAERLAWVLNHPEENRVMGERARARAKEFFSPEAYVRDYENLFRMAEQAIA